MILSRGKFGSSRYSGVSPRCLRKHGCRAAEQEGAGMASRLMAIAPDFLVADVVRAAEYDLDKLNFTAPTATTRVSASTRICGPTMAMRFVPACSAAAPTLRRRRSCRATVKGTRGPRPRRRHAVLRPGLPQAG